MDQRNRFSKQKRVDSDDLLIKSAAAVALLAIGFGLARWIGSARDTESERSATVATDASIQESARQESEPASAPRAAQGIPTAQQYSAQDTRAVVFKCRTSSGADSIQSEPCSATEETTWARPVQPSEYREADEEQHRAAEIQRHEEEVRRYTQMYGESAAPAFVAPSQAALDSAQSRNRCQAQKNHRDEVLRRVGLNRTFDLLRQLDDQVYEACKGT